MNTKKHAQTGSLDSRALIILLLCAAAKHLKTFASGIPILAALILGLMCLTQQTDSQSPAQLPNQDRGDPRPPGDVGGPCVEVAPSVWRQEDPTTGERTKPCSPSHPVPVPVPPTPSPNATGYFYLIFYRGALENAGNQAIQQYNSSGKKGSLSWNGASPLQCGRACVGTPEPPYRYQAADIAYGWLNFHYSYSWLFSKDFSIQTRIGAVCEGWETGQGRLKATVSVDPYAYPAGGNWLADLIDFFGRNYTTDEMVKIINQKLPGLVGKGSTMNFGTCRSLGVSVDRDSSGRFDAFVWDQ